MMLIIWKENSPKPTQKYKSNKMLYQNNRNVHRPTRISNKSILMCVCNVNIGHAIACPFFIILSVVKIETPILIFFLEKNSPFSILVNY